MKKLILSLSLIFTWTAGAIKVKKESGLCVECIIHSVDDSLSPLLKTIKNIDKEGAKINQCAKSRQSCSSISHAIFKYTLLLKNQIQKLKTQQTNLLVERDNKYLNLQQERKSLNSQLAVCQNNKRGTELGNVIKKLEKGPKPFKPGPAHPTKARGLGL